MSKIIFYEKGPEGNWELFYGWEKISDQLSLSAANLQCVSRTSVKCKRGR